MFQQLQMIYTQSQHRFSDSDIFRATSMLSASDNVLGPHFLIDAVHQLPLRAPRGCAACTAGARDASAHPSVRKVPPKYFDDAPA